MRYAGPKDGPGLLLLHGYPQTSAMWHRMAPRLQGEFRVVCPDLRGYGQSAKPPSGEDHAAYSKRAMAADMVKVMARLGHERFLVCGHDRGARVAHRMALDHTERVIALSLLDIAPTREMYQQAGEEFARAYWHWFFLIQDAPLPETMIGCDPEFYWRLKCSIQPGRHNIFSTAALKEYLEAFSDPACIYATCEDYRAAASIDIHHDDEDGGRKLPQPLQILWAEGGVIDRCFDPLRLWRSRADDVRGQTVAASHYMAEEIPAELAERVGNFLAGVLDPLPG